MQIIASSASVPVAANSCRQRYHTNYGTLRLLTPAPFPLARRPDRFSRLFTLGTGAVERIERKKDRKTEKRWSSPYVSLRTASSGPLSQLHAATYVSDVCCGWNYPFLQSRPRPLTLSPPFIHLHRFTFSLRYLLWESNLWICFPTDWHAEPSLRLGFCDPARVSRGKWFLSVLLARLLGPASVLWSGAYGGSRVTSLPLPGWKVCERKGYLGAMLKSWLVEDYK